MNAHIYANTTGSTSWWRWTGSGWASLTKDPRSRHLSISFVLVGVRGFSYDGHHNDPTARPSYLTPLSNPTKRTMTS
jgi:hypothetical protein